MNSILINSRSGSLRDVVQLLAQRVIHRRSSPIVTHDLGETTIVPIYLNKSYEGSHSEAGGFSRSLHAIQIGSDTHPLDPKALSFLNSLEACDPPISFNQTQLQSLFTLLDGVLRLPENSLEVHFVKHLQESVVAGKGALGKVTPARVARGEVFNEINLNYRSGRSENLDFSISTYRNCNELGLSLDANNPSQHCARSRPFNLTLSADEVAFISSSQFTSMHWTQLKVNPLFARIADCFDRLKSRAG